jgi:hypothetical protein
VLEREIHVCLTEPREPLEWVGDLADPLKCSRERAKIEIAKLGKQRFLIPEVVIDRCGGVLDSLSDGPHGGSLIPMPHEHGAGGIQNSGARLGPFAGTAFLATQGGPE